MAAGRSPAQAIERLSIALLVGSAVFEFATGILNAQYYYPFDFNFVVAHYYGAVVFVASLAMHVVVKLPVMVRAYRERGVLGPLRDDLAHTRRSRSSRRARRAAPRPRRRSRRRGLLGFVGAGSPRCCSPTPASRSAARCAARAARPARRRPRPGPNGFQVNKTAAGAGVTPAMTGAAGGSPCARGDARAAAQPRRAARHAAAHATLPIACVEGWSTTPALDRRAARDLAAAVGAPGAGELLVESLQARGTFRQATLGRDPVRQ